MASSLPCSEIGVVFDLDGVLIDSHDQHERAWFYLADERNLKLDKEQFTASFGARNETIIPHVFHWADPEDHRAIQELAERKETLYRELVAADGIKPLPGVISLLDSLRDAAIPVSLGSSTPRKNIEACFAATGLDRYFGENITGAEDVTKGKPDPQVFLIAAQKIKCDPSRCLVIEDAIVGIEAGVAAGMRVVAVTTTHLREKLEDRGASRIVDSLGELNVETIRVILS